MHALPGEKNRPATVRGKPFVKFVASLLSSILCPGPSREQRGAIKWESPQVPLWSTADEPAPLECGDLSPLWPWRQNESGDLSPHSISDSSFVSLLHASRGSLTPTSNCELVIDHLSFSRNCDFT